ncbi:RICIN domain-containing protein [Streptomyces sp. H27-H5]|uniref:RICIN domain-containing protein n=1 Tax=Streptomyces sp. H27-H5 TaxID=2996460 RepID=UPI002271AA26|nr:RICIN domain-containing protein [Streptomyces sp. H27-H5]MCY0960234.1 RICIN domain-containing protein [Streptomyces sp. H27-H5]
MAPVSGGPTSGGRSESAPAGGGPGRLTRLLAARTATAPTPVRGGAEGQEVQPERSARIIGAVTAASVLLALGLGTVAFMALPGGDASGPGAARVEEAAAPTVGPDGSVLPAPSASPPASGTPAANPPVAEGAPAAGSPAPPGAGPATGADPAPGSGPAPGKGAAPGPAPAGQEAGAPAPQAAGSGGATAPRPAQKPPAPAAAAPAKAVGDTIVGYGSSRCVGVSTRNGSDGSALQLQGCGGDAWQKWVFASDGSVRSMGLCMDIARASTANGADIQLARCNGGWAQRFNLNGSHDLVNTQIGKCVDTKDAGTAAGTRLQLWDCGGTSNQKWHLG